MKNVSLQRQFQCAVWLLKKEPGCTSVSKSFPIYVQLQSYFYAAGKVFSLKYDVKMSLCIKGDWQ